MKLTWDQSTNHIIYSNNPFTFDDVAITEEIIAAATDVSGNGATNWVSGFEKLDNKKKKRFIELMCKVTGAEPTKYRKEVRDVKVFTKDIQITVEKLLSIKVTMEENNVSDIHG